MKFLGLAKFHNFARIAKFSLGLRKSSEIFAILAKFPGIAALHCIAYCSSTAFIFITLPSFIHLFLVCLMADEWVQSSWFSICLDIELSR